MDGKLITPGPFLENMWPDIKNVKKPISTCPPRGTGLIWFLNEV